MRCLRTQGDGPLKVGLCRGDIVGPERGAGTPGVQQAVVRPGGDETVEVPAQCKAVPGRLSVPGIRLVPD